MFQKILIANRGEIACRIIKTAKRLGIETVAIYSTADQNARHVQLADSAFCVGPAPAIDSYLNQAAILQIAIDQNVDAIHPGYGFLSENEAFSAACAKAGLIFIGPPASAIHAMGSKNNAKTLMEKAGVPVLPGYHGAKQDTATLVAHAEKIGFPLLIKPAAGGGGKGMHLVQSMAELNNAIESSKREAKASFGDDTLLLERYLVKPRHIEIQIFADQHQNCVHCFERDCSTQRRHQKIIEEAPALQLDDAIRQQMGQAAVNCAKAISYVGAGTVEFLLTDTGFYFMEMNTRLQVEHPVTEMILGIDLVEWQLRVAFGEPLPMQQEQLIPRGHAIEARVYAENPAQQFLPSTGRLIHCQFPENNEHWRIDTGVQQNDEISMYYDPMIAKVIAHGETRQHAISQLQKCLSECQIIGVTTNISFLQSLLHNKLFNAKGFSTDYLDTHLAELIEEKPIALTHTAFAGIFYYLLGQRMPNAHANDPNSPWDTRDHWQMALLTPVTFTLTSEMPHTLTIAPNKEPHSYFVTVDGTSFELEARLTENQLTLNYQNQRILVHGFEEQDRLHLFGLETPVTVQRVDPMQSYQTTESKSGQLTAPMPGTVVAVMVETGNYVEKGTSLMVIEAMKMEHTIHAPTDGMIEAIYFQTGDIVSEGNQLLALANKDKA